MKLDDWNDRTHRKTRTRTVPCIRRLDSIGDYIDIEDHIVLTHGMYWVILDSDNRLVFGPWHSITNAVSKRELTRWKENSNERV